MGILFESFGTPYPTPYMWRPDAVGSRRKSTEAKNIIARPKTRIFHWELALELWFAAPHPYVDKPEANNPVNTALELLAAVPDGLTWELRKPTEAHGSSRKLKIE